jgi:hypothetical protein
MEHAAWKSHSLPVPQTCPWRVSSRSIWALLWGNWNLMRFPDSELHVEIQAVTFI